MREAICRCAAAGMEQAIRAILLLPVFAILISATAIAQDQTGKLGDRVASVVRWNQAFTDYRNQQHEALQREREAMQKKSASRPETDLPQEPPIELLAPWVFEPTLQRQAIESRYPEVFAEQRKKIISTGPDILKVPWFRSVSQNYAAHTERNQKQGWLDELAVELSDKLKRLKSLSGVQKSVLEKEIRHRVALAERIACTLASCTWPEPKKGKDKAAKPIQPKLPNKIELPPIRQTSGSADKALRKAEKPKLKLMTGFASGLLYQIGLHHERLGFEAHDKDAYRKIMAAKEATGDGKAGGGGVSLHRPAVIEGPLDPAVIERAVVTDGRLVLMMRDGSRVRMPKMQLDDLAVAIRTIYGPSGILEGTLEAVDGESIVYKTGPEQFGDVVWRKSYLPQPWKERKKGERIGLAIPPAVGILGLPEPSVSRITYYGDIKNTRIGRVISEADRLLGLFISGVDPETGKFIRPPKVAGFMTVVETDARLGAGQIKLPPWKPVPKRQSADPYKNSWWRSGAFYVWVPERVLFKYVAAAKKVVPVDVRMKLENWTSHPRGPQPLALVLSDFVSRNFKQLAQHYPVLDELNDVAATVSIVRWLKVNNIAVDQKWASERKLAPVMTPERTKEVWTGPVNGRDGKPVFRKVGAVQ
ncbi:MAG: hypothetical protein JKY32_07875 [Rhizobiales bacterium]|nr:hypothetical protein [Hyphomicrobiales bacterium]